MIKTRSATYSHEIVDRRDSQSYIGINCALGAGSMENDNLTKLEQRIDELIGACRRLSKENHALKSGQQDLSAEHARLVEKTQLARSRIEAMIGRLKALERS